MSYSTTNPQVKAPEGLADLIKQAGSGAEFFRQLDRFNYPLFRRDDDEYYTFCPVHEASGARDPSLHITITPERVRSYCFVCGESFYSKIRDGEIAECTATYKPKSRGSTTFGLNSRRACLEIKSGEAYLEWCNQVGLEEFGFPYEVAEYFYDGGEFAKVRWSDKNFTWLRRSNGGYSSGLNGQVDTVPLYGVDELKPEGLVFAVEGEKDVETVRGLGFQAVSYVYTGRQPKTRFAALRGRDVVALQDNDDAGRGYINRLIEHGGPYFGSLRVLPPLGDAKGYDVTDWVLRGGGKPEELLKLVAAAEPMPVPEDRAETADELQAEDLETEEARERIRKDAEALADRGEVLELSQEILAERRRRRANLSPDTLFVDLSDVENRQPPKPTVLITVEDISLLYPGEINKIFGRGGSLKSMLALYTAKQVLMSGGVVAMLSLELNEVTVFDRLHRTFGVPVEVIKSRMLITREALVRGKDVLEGSRLKTGRPADLMIVDSTNKVLGAYGQKGYDASEIIGYNNNLAKPFTDIGSTFLDIDHTNNTDPMRPIGNVEKVNAIQGAMYRVEVPDGHRPDRENSGFAEITLRKDQPANTGLKADIPSAWFVLLPATAERGGIPEVKLTTAGRPLFVPGNLPDLDKSPIGLLKKFFEDQPGDSMSALEAADQMAAKYLKKDGKPLRSVSWWRQQVPMLVEEGFLTRNDKGEVSYVPPAGSIPDYQTD